MPVNIIPNTEDFTAGNWNVFNSLTITPNTAAPPAFAGINAGSADKLEDPTAASVSSVFSSVVSIPVDTSSYIASIFIAKDAVTGRFPSFICQFPDGSGSFVGISCDTVNGVVANYFNTFPNPISSGVVNVDSLWWRFWFRMANDGTSSQARVFVAPCQANTIGQNDDATLTGFINAWGVNLTNDSVLQTYIPDPFYAFVGAPNPFITTVGAKRMGR